MIICVFVDSTSRVSFVHQNSNFSPRPKLPCYQSLRSLLHKFNRALLTAKQITQHYSTSYFLFYKSIISIPCTKHSLVARFCIEIMQYTRSRQKIPLSVSICTGYVHNIQTRVHIVAHKNFCYKSVTHFVKAFDRIAANKTVTINSPFK